MTKVRYTVTANIGTKEVVEEYLEWLKAGHVQALIDAGALSAEINVVETEPTEGKKVDATYVFSSREALQAYFDGPAAALREDGKVRWMDTGKINFSRRIATIDFVI